MKVTENNSSGEKETALVVEAVALFSSTVPDDKIRHGRDEVYVANSLQCE